MTKHRNRLLFILSIWVFCGGFVQGQTVLFSDDMSTGAGWTYSHFGGTGVPNPPTDSSSANFNFDYSALGIPEAPNTGSVPGNVPTRGLRLAANLSGFFGLDVVTAVYEDASFTGQYTLQVDAWLNWSPPLGVGSTEHAGVYVGFDPSDVSPVFAGQNGAGLYWASDGDTTNSDYILHKDEAEMDLFSGQYFTDDFGFGNQPGVDATDSVEGFDPQAVFPEFDIASRTGGINATGTQPAGAAGFQWVVVTVEVDTEAVGNGPDTMNPGIATFTMKNALTGDSLLVGTVDNSVPEIQDDDMNGIVDGNNCPFGPAANPPMGSEDICSGGDSNVGMSGGIGLSMKDFFNGTPFTADFAFALFDNVIVFDGFLDDGPPCDFDRDSACNITDIDLMYQELGGTDAIYDLDFDGDVDNEDVTEWLAQASSEDPMGRTFKRGDPNLNGSVEGDDFTILAFNFGGAGTWGQGNFVVDAVAGGGEVGGSDFTQLALNFGFDSSVSSVPEPSSNVFLALALLWLSVASRGHQAQIDRTS